MDTAFALLDETLALAVVAAVLGYVGSKLVPTIRRLPPSRWRTLYLATDWAHPIVAGALLGLSPTLPVPPAMGDGWAGSILWYALAGVVSLPVYRRLMRRLEAQRREQGA